MYPHCIIPFFAGFSRHEQSTSGPAASITTMDGLVGVDHLHYRALFVRSGLPDIWGGGKIQGHALI